MCDPGGTRTHDPLISTIQYNQALCGYQLYTVFFGKESAALPTELRSHIVAPGGFEPPLLRSKRSLLPLQHRAIKMVLTTSRLGGSVVVPTTSLITAETTSLTFREHATLPQHRM